MLRATPKVSMASVHYSGAYVHDSVHTDITMCWVKQSASLPLQA
jgi:hypothetical protein